MRIDFNGCGDSLAVDCHFLPCLARAALVEGLRARVFDMVDFIEIDVTSTREEADHILPYSFSQSEVQGDS